ncbi:hypothetical protein MRX96_016551 [Rhipicephalus microplus]
MYPREGRPRYASPARRLPYRLARGTVYLYRPGPCCGRWPQWQPDPLVPPGGRLSLSRGAAPTSSSPGAAYRQRCEDRRRRARTAALRAACMQVRHVSAALLASASRLLSPPQAEPSSPDDDGQDHTR